MKKIFAFLLALMLAGNLMAQAPQSFNYQAVVRDASGNIIANTQVGMKISILQGSTSGTAVCIEEYTLTTNDFGLVTLAIGNVNTTDFATIDWSTGPYFVKVELDVSGGTSYIEMGTSQLLSVPYALYSKQAGNGFSGNYNDLINKPTGVSEFDNDAGYITQFSDSIVLKAPNGTFFKISVQNDGTLATELTFITVTDNEGNVYKTVTIGTQVWMAENLKATKFKDGTPIPLITDNNEWGNLSTPGYCWYDNESDTYVQTYGALYNWYTVNTGMLCPEGWHVPADEEWTILVDYLGGEEVAGGKLKETGTIHWNSPNTGATNETGFTALPGGYRDNDGSFGYIGHSGIWWSSTEYITYNAWARHMYYIGSNVHRSSGGKHSGYSVRCVKDTDAKVVLLDDVSLEISGGENIIQNHNFSNGLMHWNSWDDQQSAYRMLNNSDYNSEPSSYSINAGIMPGFVRTFYDLKEQTFDWVFDSIDPYDPNNSIWISVINGSTIDLSYWCKGVINYAHILGLDSSGNWRNLSSDGGGHPNIWTKVQKSIVVPDDIVAIGLQFDVVF